MHTLGRVLDKKKQLLFSCRDWAEELLDPGLGKEGERDGGKTREKERKKKGKKRREGGRERRKKGGREERREGRRMGGKERETLTYLGHEAGLSRTPLAPCRKPSSKEKSWLEAWPKN